MVDTLRRSEGLVLARYQVKDDRIVTLLTQADGRLPAVARRARRGSKKSAGGIEPLTRVDVTYRIQPGRDLVTLREVVCTQAFPGLRQDLERMAMASVMAEILTHFTVDFDPVPELYTLASKAFDFLNAPDSKVSEAHLLLFELRVLQHTGTLPPLDMLLGPHHPAIDAINTLLSGRWVQMPEEVLQSALSRTEAHLKSVSERPLKSRSFLNDVLSS